MLGLLALLVAVGTISNGTFTYPLDDPYIHLRLAQNLANDFTLGINPGEFASAGSSVAWPLAIAALIAAIGPKVGIPLFLSSACAVATIVLTDRWARRQAISWAIRIGLMVAMVVVVPLLLMALTGMEHVAQIGLSILLVHLSIRASFSEKSATGEMVGLGATAFALAAIRPEVVFVVGVATVMLLAKRRLGATAALVVGAATPIVATAALNLGQGWPALPASITAKSMTGADGIARLLPNPEYLASLLRRPRLVAVILILGIVLWVARRAGEAFNPIARRWGWVALSITFLHLCYSRTGWLYRYEAYLVALCVCALALGLESLRQCVDLTNLTQRTRRLLTVAVLGLAVIALLDGVRINLIGLTGMAEINHQHANMARFSAEACPGCRSVIGDIGMVSFYGDTTIVDAWGLANKEVLQAKMDGRYGAAALAEIADEAGAQWAMVYNVAETATDPPPDSWEEIGYWEWEGGAKVAGGDTIHFYVIDPAVEQRLREHFENFPTPSGATVHIL